MTRLSTLTLLAALTAACAGRTSKTTTIATADTFLVTRCSGKAATDTSRVFSEREVDTPARSTTPGGTPAPAPPPSLTRLRQPQSTLSAFVVDTAGRVERCSGEIVRTTHPAWSAEAIKAVVGMTFTPARRRGVPVRQRVTMPFDLSFTSGRR